ncbi:MAG: hypothetical protein ACRENE_26135, partial [Polyangiaceae bacterium]
MRPTKASVFSVLFIPLAAAAAAACGGKVLARENCAGVTCYEAVDREGGIETMDDASSSGSPGSKDGGSTGPTTCGGKTCSKSEVCCVALGGGGIPGGTGGTAGGTAGGGASSGQCQSATQTCNGIALSCASEADCAGGDVCCSAVSFSGTGLSGASSCKPSPCSTGMTGGGAGGLLGGGFNFQLCAGNAECPKGQTCQMMYGGQVCAAPGGGAAGGVWPSRRQISTRRG